MSADASASVRSRLTAAAIVALVLMVYWPGLDGGFVFDDSQNLLLNPALSPERWDARAWLEAILSSPSSTLQRPLAMASFAANAALTGLDPWSMKLSNVALHAVNGVLAFALLRVLLQVLAPAVPPSTRFAAAAAAAFAWSLHPINLMATLYVVQRMESLSHLFVLGGLLLYVRGRMAMLAGQGGWPSVLCGYFLGTALGVLSKESAALLPVYCLVVETIAFRFQGAGRAFDRRLGLFYALFLLLPTACVLVFVLPDLIQPGHFLARDFTLLERLMTEPRVLAKYLSWIVWPDLSQLSLYHDDIRPSHGLFNPPSTAIGFLLLGVLAAATWMLRRARPAGALGLGWFLAAHLLTGTVLPLELAYEHRNYFASLGICLAIADFLVIAPSATRWRGWSGAAMVVFVLMLGVCTFLRSTEWSSPLRFALSEAAKHPASPRATYGAGVALARLAIPGRDNGAAEAALDAFARARQVPGSGVLPHQAELILRSRLRLPDDPAVWRDLQARLRVRRAGPEQIHALVALDECAISGGCAFPPNRMIATFQSALATGQHAGVLAIYGKYAVHVLRDAPLAVGLWTEARDLEPTNPQFRINLAMLMLQLGREPEARAEIAALRSIGRFGQYEQAANQLEAYAAHVRALRGAEPQ